MILGRWWRPWWLHLKEKITRGLSLSKMADYRIYYRTETGSYQNQFDVNDSAAEHAQISGVPLSAYYLVMITIDMDGRESSYSSKVVVTL